ncbi:uncharacterized protein LOC142175475 isoform X2 [Nicotiana tabacum]|uniref:Uncharacterized protein LOC142175475 isoform X2 n=1 Tax=Nicotiana tabacum TaxID=4097 RepID=A0AC58TMH1_TOBAC
MGGMRLLPEESDVAMVRTPAAATDLISDDDRSVSADSWSIKSEYGSTLDDEQRHADATEPLAAVNYRAACNYRFGADVMEIVTSWTKALCSNNCQNHLSNHVVDGNPQPVGLGEKDLVDWSVLDIGTGNGLLLQEFAKQGFDRQSDEMSKIG